jgi:S1-C subfamily serine protease
MLVKDTVPVKTARSRLTLAAIAGALAAVPCSVLAATPASTGATRPAVFAPAEQSVINIFKRVSPSVVSVANKAILRDLFDSSLYEVPQGAGTGFVWDKEGHVISNFHVVYGAAAIQVTLNDGTSYNAELVGQDPDEDIAILKIDAPKTLLTPVEPGRSADLQVGQTVLAIGNPFGLDTSLSLGVVSALGRNITSMSRRMIHNVIQTDAAINPGNSGGPLLDSSGRLIGMNTAIVSPSGVYAGVGFAVPVDTIRRAVPQLLKTGRVQRPTLGIRMVPQPLSRRAAVDRGVPILSVVPGSAAERANLKGVRQTRGGDIILGDIIMEIDGVAVNSDEDVSAAIDRHQVGDEIRVTLQRGDSQRTVTVKLRDAE